MAVLVLDGYGLIGSAIVDKLCGDVEIVINAASVLQQGLSDDPAAIQARA